MKNILIKTIITIIWLIIILIWVLYHNREIGITPNSWVLRNEPLLKAKINNRLEVTNNYEFNDSLNFYLSSFKNSSYFPIDEKINIILPKYNIERSESILKNFNYALDNYLSIEDYDIHIVDYSYELLKYLLENKKSIDWVFEYKEQEQNMIITDYELVNYFSQEKIDNLNIWNSYFSDKKKTLFIKPFLSEQIFVDTVFNMTYQWKQERNWFTIEEWSYPLIFLSKYKIKWTWILANKYNENQLNKIENIFNNIDETIKNSEFILKENENKALSWQYQSIKEFTTLDYDKYIKYYIENNKVYNVLKIDWKKVLLENDDEYVIIYLDQDNKYPYIKETLPLKWENHIFNNVKFIIPTISLWDNLYIKLKKELSEIWFNNSWIISELKVTTVWWNIKIKEE